ncbi:hypothetical protein C9927_03580 [Pseudidiomarina aestuarii]|uniref:Polysaccharide biosynthesis protein n=1 Tax=Pseudidiomarina aestuarii TaxID=624146 RepID=A0A2T4CYT6_9GAMM|nr:hypothetical protein C9988_02660 [Pseudidiomarina aestuarii]PTB86715.1 hypothetical protein C9939_03370 [Pseudidiomarina aestuarii]PTB88643.1 hypothetical protein C9927_03580 [Pseudidiomarina aestuarii]PTB89162.1 hypothetical protein C9928_04470 [Pseudidiomarina aestuarii]
MIRLALLKIISGSVLSQLIMLCALPFLTRLYTPEDFSILAFYVAALAPIIVISSLRYDVAIPIPDNSNDSDELLKLSIIITSLMSLISLIVIIILMTHGTKLHVISSSLFVLPLGILFGGLFNIFQYYCIRNKEFGLISNVKVSQAIIAVIVQVVLALIFGAHAEFLIIGHSVFVGAGVIYLLVKKHQVHPELLVIYDNLKLLKTAKKYKDFPKYSTFDSLVNSLGTQLPIIIIGFLAGGSEIGFILLAMKLLGTPVSLISGAVGQVFYSSAREHIQAGTLQSFSIKFLIPLLFASILMILLFSSYSGLMIDLMLGSEWNRVAEIIELFVFWYAVQLVSSPFSMIMHIQGKQRQLLALTIFGFLARIIPLFLISYFNLDVEYVFALSIFSFFFYLLCFYVFMRTIDFDKKIIVLVCSVFLILFQVYR